MSLREFAIHRRRLLVGHLNRGKQRTKPRALHLIVLFFGIALGHEDEAVTASKLTQRLLNSGKQFDLLGCNRL